MSNRDSKFPIYRKSVNSLNFYCVISESRFIELQAVGSRWFRYELVAEIWPTRLLIADLIACADAAYLLSTEEEFLEIAAKVQLASEKP